MSLSFVVTKCRYNYWSYRIKCTNNQQDNLHTPPLDISGKILQLKAARTLASEITEQGSTLYDSLEKEMEQRDIRHEVISRPFELKTIERGVVAAVDSLKDQISTTKTGLENLSSDETNLMAKIDKKKTELDRADKRLKSLQGVRYIL